VSDKGSITPTSGLLAQRPMRGGSAVSLVNAGLEGFVRAAALEAPCKGARERRQPGPVHRTARPPWHRGAAREA
jgi:hypothetical protein